MRLAERLVALAIGAIGVALILAAAGLPAGKGGDFGPGYFPRLLGVLCIAAAAAVWFHTRRTPPDAPPEIHGRWRLAVGGAALIALYMALAPALGYFIATPLFAGAMVAYAGLRSPRWVLGTAIGFTVGAWLLFYSIFGVPLPLGALESVFAAGSQEAYPTKPITFVVWSNPGSPTDLSSRVVAKAAEPHLGQPIVVVNKPGGGGLTALRSLKTERADGYMVLNNTASLLALLSSPETGHVAVDDFVYVARLMLDPNMLAVPAESPHASFEEFLGATRSEPGKLKVGGFESGGYGHVVFTKMMELAGGKATWIPYRSSNDAMTAAMGYHVDAVFSNPQVLRGGIESNRLRPLAVTTRNRLESYPDVPTALEAGIQMEEYQWRGVMVRKGTPPAVVAKLEDALRKAMQDSSVQAYLKQADMTDGFLPSDQYTAAVQREVVEFRQLVASLERS
jgi:putative tricarboxylic transport membrane protein